MVTPVILSAGTARKAGPTSRMPAYAVRGRHSEYPGGAGAGLGTFAATFTGVGPFHRDDPADRPLAILGKTVTLHRGPRRPAHLLLPAIPPGR
jgi:hypothetical protein